MPANDALSSYQVGINSPSAHGTLVAATAKLAVPRIDFDESGVVHRPQLARGVLVRNRGNEVVTARGTIWTISDCPLNYEQLQLWLAISVTGAVTAVGAIAPYTWTYTRSLTADPAPDSLTLERRVSDFSSNVDHEWGYAMARKLTFRYAENEPLRQAIEGFARRVQSSTHTASLSMPTPEIAPSALAKLYINDAWASIGTTQVASQIIGAEWEFNTGFTPKMTADGRTDLDFTLHIVNANEVSMRLSLTCMMDPTVYAAEKAQAVAQTLRAVQMQVSGSSSRDLKLKGLFKYSKPDIIQIGEQDGQAIVVLELEEAHDGTNLFEAVLVNTTNAPDGV